MNRLKVQKYRNKDQRCKEIFWEKFLHSKQDQKNLISLVQNKEQESKNSFQFWCSVHRTTNRLSQRGRRQENKKQTNEKTIKIHKHQNYNCKNWPKTATMTQKKQNIKNKFSTQKKKNTWKENKKEQKGQWFKILLPENKDKRGGRINFQKTKLRLEA